MSKTEMISVPREVAEAAWQALDDDGRFEESCPLREALDLPAEQPQGEPVALPERCVSKLLSAHHVRGWNACLDEIAKLGPLFTRAAPIERQGEPFAWFMPDMLCDDTVIGSKVRAGGFTVPLFTHADPGEVEQLRELANSNVRWEAVANEQMGVISTLRTQLAKQDAQVEGLRADSKWLRDELDKALLQLAERDALLGEAWEHDISTPLKRKIRAALSASAEPSAPVECAICRDLGGQCMECEEVEFREWADRHFASADYRKTDAGVFIQDWMRHAYAAWCARASLERKP